MTRFLDIPRERLEPQVLRALLEEFASRDGTDYGERELSLDQKRENLVRQLDSGELKLLYDNDAQTWDLVPKEEAQRLLGGEDHEPAP